MLMTKAGVFQLWAYFHSNMAFVLVELETYARN